MVRNDTINRYHSMMVGCVAGEAQLDDGGDAERAVNAQLLARADRKACPSARGPAYYSKGISEQLPQSAGMFRAQRFHQNTQHERYVVVHTIELGQIIAVTNLRDDLTGSIVFAMLVNDGLNLRALLRTHNFLL
jgi:hypothetical protein